MGTKKWGEKSQNQEESENKVCIFQKPKKGLNSKLIYFYILLTNYEDG